MGKKKILIIILAVVVCLGAGVFLAKDLIIKSAVIIATSRITGTKVSIEKFSFGVLKHSLSMRGFKMYNPEGFQSGLLLDLPKADVDYDFPSLKKGKIHLMRVDVELREILIEKNPEGKLNVDSLKIAREESKDAKEKKGDKELAMQIDLLNLRIDKVILKDYTHSKEKPVVKAYDINLKKSYKNVTSAEHLIALILVEPMKRAGIKGAMIYGAAALAGVAILPVAVAATFVGKDSVRKDFDVPIDDLYGICLKKVERIGKVKKEEKDKKTIAASVSGADVIIKFRPLSDKATQITISARKYFLPKPEIANGVLYQVAEEVK